MQVFYVNIGGGEPTVRPDFWELLDYSIDTMWASSSPPTGSSWTPAAPVGPDRLRDVQISLDGATASVNDRYADRLVPHGVRALENLASAGFAQPKISVVMTRHNVTSWTSSKPSRTSSARSCGSPGYARPAGARTCGTSCTRRRHSSASSTTGWWPR